jgi:hypothetical protein
MALQNYLVADCVFALINPDTLIISCERTVRLWEPDVGLRGCVYAWHTKPEALTQLTPPWENARFVERTGSIEQPGSRVKIRLRAALSSRPGQPSALLANRGVCFATQ